MPVMVWVPAAIVGAGVMAMLVQSPCCLVLVVEMVVGLSVGFAASHLRFRLARRTPLAQQRRQYLIGLRATNPKPKRCDRGPGRGVAAGQLQDFHVHFGRFIQERDMYYVASSIVIPITEHHKLSFAEVVGPG